MPDWRPAIEGRLEGLRVDPARAREIIDELSQHLDDRYTELRAGGADDDLARRDALVELDDQDLVSALAAVETARASELPPIGGTRRGSVAASAWQDLRYAARVLRRNPAFTLVAVLTLALGIGATTAIFSVVNGVMLRPLPFVDSDRLVRMWESDLPRGRPTFSVSEPNFLDFRSRNSTFEFLAAENSVTLNLAGSDGVEPLSGSAVTADFLRLLGAAPIMGRNFTLDEQIPGQPTNVVIVTYGFWRQRLGGDPQVLSRTLTLNDRPHAIVGVLPAWFRWASSPIDLFVPFAPRLDNNRGDHRLSVIGKLKSGVSLQQASADMNAIAAQLSAQYPESNGGWTVLLRSFYDWLIPETTRRMLIVFLAAVGFVLFIAATNVANLMLARAAARQKELSIRVALGAGRGRVLSQLLVEAVLLALIGGVFGCVIAVGATAALQALAPPNVPRLDEVGVDARALLFALSVSIVTGVLFGLTPAVLASRSNTGESLKDAGRTGTGGASRQRLRHALVVVEVASSVALLVAAGLLIRSMWTLQNVDPGFDPRTLLTMRVSATGASALSPDKVRDFYGRVLDAVANVPGVRASGLSSGFPMGGGNTSIEVVVEGRPLDSAGRAPGAEWRVVSPGYFDALGVTIRGRNFDARDSGDTRNVIISAEMARRYWPGADAVGGRLFWHSATGPQLTIVGVASDVRNISLDTDPAPVIYLPMGAVPANGLYLAVRSDADPRSQIGTVRQTILSVDPKAAISRVRTAEDIIALSVGPRRFTMILLVSFATVALALACVGLFGVMSYLVSQRTHDIGVRLALGAMPRDVFRVVVGRGMVLAGTGAALGLAAAFWLSRSLESLLFQVRPTDAITFVTVAVVLMGVALVACYVPARRATRVDPVIALRYE